jgi:hypothetical protein
MRKLIPLLCLLFMAPSFAEGLYKWVDETGQVHYSDVPRDGAEEVNIDLVQTFSLPASTASPVKAASDEADEEDAVIYDSLVITSPTMEETIWNTGGVVTVGVYLQPGLQVGHQIRLYVDGTLVPMPERSSSAVLTDVTRGEHTVSAEVQDPSGRSLITAEPIKFFYQQTSVNRRP